MPFGLHLPELVIVLVIALLVFGPKKLPEMGSAIGKSIKEFKKGVNEISTPKDPEISAPPPLSQEEINKLATGAYTSAATAREEVSTEQHKND